MYKAARTQPILRFGVVAMPAAKRASSPSAALSVQKYRKTLQDQGKYKDKKPGTNAPDGCLKDPPDLPPMATVLKQKAGIPKRGADGCFVFKDCPSFKPNLSPKEVMQLGSFGGTYYRDIVSAVSGKAYKGRQVVKEFPKDWLAGLDLDKFVCSPIYSKPSNKYKVSCGASLGQWECSGWISSLDPYGWFQWYCRFFLGRRTTDDARQIKRWENGQGPTGRWRTRLCNDLIKLKAKVDDPKASPVLRQVLQHWAYKLTEADLKKQRARK
jgi:hypothetical protein